MTGQVLTGELYPAATTNYTIAATDRHVTATVGYQVRTGKNPGVDIFCQASNGDVVWEFAINDSTRTGFSRLKVEIYSNSFAAFTELKFLFNYLGDGTITDVDSLITQLERHGLRDHTEPRLA